MCGQLSISLREEHYVLWFKTLVTVGSFFLATVTWKKMKTRTELCEASMGPASFQAMFSLGIRTLSRKASQTSGEEKERRLLGLRNSREICRSRDKQACLSQVCSPPYSTFAGMWILTDWRDLRGVSAQPVLECVCTHKHTSNKIICSKEIT